MALGTLNDAGRFHIPVERSIRAGLVGALIALAGCEPVAGPVDGGIETVRIGDRTFKLELALTQASRRLGLGGRRTLGPAEGMLFAFPDPAPQRFWMYDCLMDIDIAYLDPIGYVTAVHTMQAEPPRGPEEDELDYRSRLPGYPSLYPAQFVIELAPGTFESLGIEAGDRILIDADRLEMLGEASEDELPDAFAPPVTGQR